MVRNEDNVSEWSHMSILLTVVSMSLLALSKLTC